MTGDDIGEELAAWGKVARLETRGRKSGRAVIVTVGFVERPDGSLVVAAGDPDADWALNLLADPACRVISGAPPGDYTAHPLDGPELGVAVRDLILRYGTPAEKLGSGPAFALVPR